MQLIYFLFFKVCIISLHFCEIAMNSLWTTRNVKLTTGGPTGTHMRITALENIDLHRAECTAIFKNVVSISLKKEIKNDLQGEKYVLLVDESADVVTQRHLCMLVPCYCDKDDVIQATFLSRVPVIDNIVQILSDKIVWELTASGRTLKNCIG